MFERFDIEARRAVVLASRISVQMDAANIDTEHLFAAISLLDEKGVCVKALSYFDVVPGQLFEIAKKYGPTNGKGSPGVQIPMSMELKHVLEMGLRQALSLGRNYIEPEHLLLAIIEPYEEVKVIDPRIFIESKLDIKFLRYRILFEINETGLTSQQVAVALADQRAALSIGISGKVDFSQDISKIRASLVYMLDVTQAANDVRAKKIGRILELLDLLDTD